jgi:hypothetical protein
MQRRTRQGTQYSPFEVIQTNFSFEELVLAAQVEADGRDDIATDDVEEDSDDLSAWEDVCSRSPSPVSSASSRVSSEPSSPTNEFRSRPLSPSPTNEFPSRPLSPATSIVASEDIPDPDMPALLDSPAQRKAARQRLYQLQRRQKKRQQQAASPFTRKAHPKSMPSHRLLPAHQSSLDAAELKSSGGGSWLGPKTVLPSAKKRGAKAKSGGQRKLAPDRWRSLGLKLREVAELVEQLGYQYIRWDGK